MLSTQPDQPLSPEDIYWKAVQQRDRSQDGAFFYGVLTTGVFCKPSCGSRRPLQKNVRFFSSADQALRQGLRPCKRCKPLESQPATDSAAQAIGQICKLLKAHPGVQPSASELAGKAGMSVAHFQRTFKRLVGVTPKQYAGNLRLHTFKQALKKGTPVTESIYTSGFGSNSRVYEQSNVQLGMTPAEYRKGGEGVIISYASVLSQLGRMMLGATERGLCFVQFGETHKGLLALLQREYPFAFLEPMSKPYHSDFQRWIEQLDSYMAGSQTGLALPVDVRATAFQLRVWNYLRTIPYGEVRSYQEVAKDLGQPEAVRAVAGACAHNLLALLVPCHRVIRNNGELGGYRWGLERKRTLLALERSAKQVMPTQALQ